MRMRFKPYARPELLACDFHVHEPLTHAGHWHELYARPEQPLHLELGCGKGGFLSQLAPLHPDINYLGIDITDKVLILAKRKVEAAYAAAQLPPDNVKIASLDIERLSGVFSPADTVQRIYINFCNPWSKNAGSNKHRLTHPRQLLQYRALMPEGSEIYFKTDDDDLFRDSLGYFPAAGFEITWQTFDLHKNEPDWNLRTEHEGMFSEQGIPIKALIARKGPDSSVTGGRSRPRRGGTGMTTYALLHTIFFFFVYAFLGWCVEVAYAAITTRELVNRGFLNGPICPIYGCGMTVMIAVLGRFTMPSSDVAWYQNVLVAFFGGMVITTLVELVGGYILYKMFHTRWWDYSMYRFNLGGFICPQFSLLWGLGSVLLMVVVHPLLSKPSAAIPTLVLIWLDVIFGGLFLADLIVSAIQAVGFSKQLARIDELRKAMRTTSDALTEVIGTSAMTMDTLLDEQKLQLTLAAMEGATNAAELRDQLRELAGKAGTLRDTTIRLSKQRFFGTGRLLRAFPDMVPDRREALASLRVGLTKATARAKAAAKQAVKTGKNAMKKEDK